MQTTFFHRFSPFSRKQANLLFNALDELAYLTQSEGQDSKRQDDEPGHRVQSYIVEDAVDTGDVDNRYKHYERETYCNVHHLVGEQSELENRYLL